MVCMGAKAANWYIVVWCIPDILGNLHELYCGHSADEAASEWIPGTALGSGRTRKEALAEATCRASIARRARLQSANRWVEMPTPVAERDKDDPTPAQIERAKTQIREKGYRDRYGRVWPKWGGDENIDRGRAI